MNQGEKHKSDSDRLRQLLKGALAASEEAELLSEIERDESISTKLEELAADQQFREDVREYLGKPNLPDASLLKILQGVDKMTPVTEQPRLDFLSPIDSDSYIGQFDGYHVIECVGSGGMGIVLKAYDPTLSRIVALKVLAPQIATNSHARQRFLREGRAAAAVSNDHIITIHAVGESDGMPYMVMEMIHGTTLQRKIDESGSLSLAEVLRIGMQTASGLAAAHAQGLIHRDIKPANILLENSVERVKITDFGLARAVDEIGITQIGMVTGTPEYMSPEQAHGETLDARSDLFSLGSVMYAMCTGESPFRSESLTGTIRRVCEVTPQPIREYNREVPNWLVSIIDKLHAKSPEARYETSSEVADLLERSLADVQQGIVADTDAESNPRSSNWLHPLWLIALVSVALLAIGVGTGRWYSTSDNFGATSTEQVNSAKMSVAEPLEQLITLQAPYTAPYPDAPTDKLSVQYAVMAICDQIGMSYQWEKSKTNTAPLNRRWVKPHFVDVPANQVLAELLEPLGLTFETKAGNIYLSRKINGENDGK